EGAIVLISGNEAYAPSGKLQEPFVAVNAEGNWQRASIRDFSPERVRHALLDDWTQWERIADVAHETYVGVRTWIEGLGWYLQAPFWIAVFWGAAIAGAAATWLLAPHKLADWSMPATGKPALPQWQSLAGILMLFGFLGTTRRPLKA